VSVISGERVAELRKRRGWSQHELARQAGVTAPVISRMERNLQQDYDFFVILGVARSLGVPIESLLTDDAPPDAAFVPELQQALRRLERASHDVQKHIGRLIDAYLDAL
jgi:transcriptional regulator with XRE-family HTH domain